MTKFEMELPDELIRLLKEIRTDLSADRYYSLDYDLRENYKPATDEDVIKYLLKRDKYLRSWECDMSDNLIKIVDVEGYKKKHAKDKLTGGIN